MNYDHGDKLRNATQWTIIFCFGLGVGAAIEGWRGGNRTFAAIGVGLIAAGCTDHRPLELAAVLFRAPLWILAIGAAVAIAVGYWMKKRG